MTSSATSRLTGSATIPTPLHLVVILRTTNYCFRSDNNRRRLTKVFISSPVIVTGSLEISAPTLGLVACGVVAGLALAAKHSAILLVPMLILIAERTKRFLGRWLIDTGLPSICRSRPPEPSAATLRFEIPCSIFEILNIFI